MTIAAVKRNTITNAEFKEIHYTVTAPRTPRNIGGFGVHITLVRHGDSASRRDRVHVYFKLLNGQLEIIQRISDNHNIVDSSLFRDWKAAALAFFRETCAKEGWREPGALRAPAPAQQSYDQAFPALVPQPIIPLPPQTHVQAVALPVNSNVAPVVVAMPLGQDVDHFDVVQSVLDASGAFDDYDVVDSVLAASGAFD